MSYQFPEKIIINNIEMDLFSEPLSRYIKRANINLSFKGFSLLRRYIATWTIIENKLFLVKIVANLSTGEQVSVSTLFPNTSTNVFADWFTGWLVIPQGNLLKSGCVGFDDIYEKSLMININKGVITEQMIKENKI